MGKLRGIYKEEFIELMIILSIASIFISKYTIYPVIFGLTILCILINVINRYNTGVEVYISDTVKKIGIFLAIAIITTIFNKFIIPYNPSKNLIIKLIINMSLLITSVIYIDNIDPSRKHNLERKIIRVVEVMIIINFLQIIYIYLTNGLFLNFLNGDFRNSSDAYIISKFGNFFGGQNKNIWSSKAAFLQMVYSFYIIKKDKNNIMNKKNITFFIINIITILLLLSRTGQLAMISVNVFIICYYIYNTEFYKKNKKGMLIALVGILLLMLIIFFKKIFHFNLNMNDGGVTRVYIWFKFFTNFLDTNFLFGNGIDYGATFMRTIVNRQESNLHNIVLSITLETGILGITVYTSFLLDIFKQSYKENKIRFIAIILLPFIIITSSQYLGYDNDLIIFFIIMYFLGSSYEDSLKKEN